ncbi:hypothetical protein Micbo1qcDRAFT_210005 [Microdochium bolleyi]|uniref:Uncharacterized protein n=1 Tax=Microdochium bolleyi TaxID=196109 RepID=A0A136IKA8_9PEZI|nr:hypothetical protein Micbo1qcDRAFT_210005 [Microdochium bolleyi]
MATIAEPTYCIILQVDIMPTIHPVFQAALRTEPPMRDGECSHPGDVHGNIIRFKIPRTDIPLGARVDVTITCGAAIAEHFIPFYLQTAKFSLAGGDDPLLVLQADNLALMEVTHLYHYFGACATNLTRQEQDRIRMNYQSLRPPVPYSSYQQPQRGNAPTNTPVTTPSPNLTNARCFETAELGLRSRETSTVAFHSAISGYPVPVHNFPCEQEVQQGAVGSMAPPTKTEEDDEDDYPLEGSAYFGDFGEMLCALEEVKVVLVAGEVPAPRTED